MKTKSFLVMTAIVLSLLSCKKKEDATNPYQDNSASELKSFFNTHSPETQTFTVNLDNDNVIVNADNGTQLVLPKGAFKHVNGSSVSGDIKIEIKEILTKSKMLLSNVTTVSGGKVLESGGEIYINATANGQQLIINPDTSIVIGVPKSETNANMGLFIGQGNGDNFDWKEQPKKDTIDNVKQGPNGDFNPNTFFMYEDFFCSCYNATHYFASITTLGWINMDCFYSNNSTVKNIVVNSPGFDKNNSALFIVLKNKNSVINVYSDIAFHNGYYELSLPNGEEITAIAIGYKDGKPYFAKNDFQVSASLSIDLVLTETTESAITSEINSSLQ